jgi:ribosomal protein S18 acetylase RimI-like enzyme
MIAQALRKRSLPGHIRPFNPVRDLGALAGLIEEAFREELAITGSSIVRDMRQMAFLGPLLWATRPVMPFSAGYVWIEKGRLVGNVSLNQEAEHPFTWVLSNVAVSPEFRGRGIAGQLLDVAITHVRRNRGQRILLQVRADNHVALALYRHRGFVTFDTLHELNLATHNWPLILGPTKAPLRRVGLRDGQRLYQLVVASTPREVLLRRPLRSRDFRRGPWWRLGQGFQLAFNGQQLFELVVEQQGELVAYGSIKAHLFQGPHELALYVLPGQRGRWESPLVEGLINLIQGMPRYDLRAYISASHPEGLRALGQLGFETLRVLEQMSLELA